MDLAETAPLPDLDDRRREDLILVLGWVATASLSDDDRHQVRLELALLHAEAGRISEALQLVREAHRMRPTRATARVWHELALRATDPEEAASALDAEVQHASSDAARAALEIARGRAAEEKGDPEGALRSFKQASMRGKKIEAAWAAERVAASLGRWKEAADAAQQTAHLTSHRDAAGEWIGSAVRYRLLGDERDAAAALLRGAAQGVDAPGLWLGWELFAASGDDASAWVDLRRAQLEASPAAETAIDAALIARYRLADDVLARSFLELALETSQGDAKRFVLSELTELVDPLTDLEDWMAHAEARREIEPQGPIRARLTYQLARVRADYAGDPEGARELAYAVLDDDPLHGPAIELAARLTDVSSGEALAARLRTEADAAPSEEWRAEALLRLADCLAAVGTDDERLGALAEAERALPGDRGIFESLESMLALREDHAALAALRERALPGVSEPIARHRLLLGIAHACTEHLEDPERAREALREAVGIEGEVSLEVEAQRLLVRLLEPEARIEVLTQLVEKDPAAAPLHRAQLAGLFAAAGERSRALDVVRERAEEAPARHPVRRLAQAIFVSAERPSDLLALYDRAAAEAADGAKARWLHRASDVCAWELDQPDECLARLRAALEVAPEAVTIHASLRDELAKRRSYRALLDLESEDDDPIAVMRRATALEGVGDDDAAADAYARAVDLGLGFARLALERILLQKGRWEELVTLWAATPVEADPGRAAGDRFRAAVMASELLGDAARASELCGAALAAAPDSIAAHLLGLRLMAAGDPFRPLALEEVLELSDDPALRRAAQREKAHITDDAEEALALWRAIGLADPHDVVAEVRTSVALESAGRTRDQQAWAQSMEQTRPSDPALETLRTVRLARRSASLGSLRAAADAWNDALDRPERPFLASLELPRLYRLLDQPELLEQGLADLARRLPRGPLAARTAMVLAETLSERGDKAGALAHLERASVADPTYYPALVAIAEACEPHSPTPMIDALLRAFESDERRERLPGLGVHLGRLLTQAGRLDLAREVLERVVSIDPSHLPGQLWLADVCERLEDRQRLFEVLEAISELPAVSEELRLRALSRRLDLALCDPADPEKMRAAAMALGRVAPDHPKVFEATLATARAEGNHRRTASVLERLIGLDSLPEAARVGYLFELATIKADKLGDVTAAIRALAEIRAPDAKAEAVRRLVELGDKSGRWDIASQALEAALDEADQLEESWELTIRRRLASLFSGPLEDPEAAARQLRRIVALDETDIDALERLVALADDPDETMRLTRLLFAARPSDHALLERLRTAFLELGDDDAAFVAEAVAVGVGSASEEVEYFYRQRRTFLGSGAPERSLTEEELASFIPPAFAPVVGFLRAIESALPNVFPTDFAAYGIRPDEPPNLDAGLAAVVEAVAELFAIETPKTYVVAPQHGPAVEYFEGAPILLVPRSLLDVSPREQSFVLGCLGFRVATRTAWGDPCRADALQARFLGYVLSAAAHELAGDDASSGSAVQDDIRERLSRAMSEEMRAAAASERGDSDIESVDPAALLRASAVAAGCAGLLTARDPAAAIAAMRRWKRLVGGDDEAERDVIRYAISEPHHALRASLGLGLAK